MAATCSFFLTYIFIVASLSFVDSHNVSLDFKLTYITKSPLGVPQQVIAINGLFPGPVLKAITNYDVSVNVHNRLDEDVLISWSGVQMRSNSWQDGVLGTNCPIPVHWNWTYKFQLKDQIGSFFYFPSLKLQRASGGFGSIIVNNRESVPLPFSTPDGDIVIFINDWYIQSHVGLRTILDDGKELGIPDGVLINGKGPYRYNTTIVPIGIDYESIDARPGKTYRLHVHNVGVSTSLNFRIQNHTMVLVETEGSYTMQQNYSSLDIHVGQSYSFLVTMDQNPTQDYYIVASARFVNESTWKKVIGVAVLHYIGASKKPTGPLPDAPDDVYDKTFSMNQARSIRSNVSASGARPNAQGSFRYGSINITETFVLVNEEPVIFNGKRVTTINGNSFKQPQTPFILADQYNLTGIYNLNLGINPFRRERSNESSLINGTYKGFMEIILQNNNTKVQSYHLDGYSFFLAGMDYGVWTENSRGTYNKWDGVSRSTTQVYPGAWTAVLVSLDNAGIWNLRIENLDNWYRGQETYLKIYNPEVSSGINRPENVLFCGALSKYQKTQSLESSARRDSTVTLVWLLMVIVHLFSIFRH